MQMALHLEPIVYGRAAQPQSSRGLNAAQVMGPEAQNTGCMLLPGAPTVCSPSTSTSLPAASTVQASPPKPGYFATDARLHSPLPLYEAQHHHHHHVGDAPSNLLFICGLGETPIQAPAPCFGPPSALSHRQQASAVGRPRLQQPQQWEQ